MSPCGQRLVHRAGVAPERRVGHAELVVAAAGHDLRAERRAEEVERPPEGGARVLLVELGPEEGEQDVAPVEPAGRGDGEVRQQGQPLRLPEDGADFFAVRVAQVEHAERLEADHRVEDGAGGGSRNGRPGVHGAVRRARISKPPAAIDRAPTRRSQ